MRDPYGFRPLVMGTRDGQVLFASETCALEMFQAQDIREVAPGEIVTVEGTQRSYREADPQRSRRAAPTASSS